MAQMRVQEQPPPVKAAAAISLVSLRHRTRRGLQSQPGLNKRRRNQQHLRHSVQKDVESAVVKVGATVPS